MGLLESVYSSHLEKKCKRIIIELDLLRKKIYQDFVFVAIYFMTKFPHRAN